MEDIEIAPPAPHVQAFVATLLNAGGMLVGLVENLIDSLSDNGSSEEEAASEVVAMLMGTVAVRLASVPEADFDRAAELMERTAEAVLTDLRRAERLARQRRRGRERERGAASGRRRSRPVRRP